MAASRSPASNARQRLTLRCPRSDHRHPGSRAPMRSSGGSRPAIHALLGSPPAHLSNPLVRYDVGANPGQATRSRPGPRGC